MKGIPTSDLWILIAEGEGAASAVVADLRAGLHKFTCCCPGDDPQKCGAQEWLTEILSDMENKMIGRALRMANHCHSAWSTSAAG